MKGESLSPATSLVCTHIIPSACGFRGIFELLCTQRHGRLTPQAKSLNYYIFDKNLGNAAGEGTWEHVKALLYNVVAVLVFDKF